MKYTPYVNMLLFIDMKSLALVSHNLEKDRGFLRRRADMTQRTFNLLVISSEHALMA